MKAEESARLRKETYHYSPENAVIYSQLGVIGTTYEVSFNEMLHLLGPLQGKKLLDFGSGTGRSTRLLKTSGADEVIGVDHDINMINEAKKNSPSGVYFELVRNNLIPLLDNSIDAAVTAHVWVEMKSLQEMQQSANEIYRVLKKGGQFIVVTTSPHSIGYDYVSYRYKKRKNLKSGEPIICIVKGDKPFEIDDIYWEEKDILQVLRNAGFKQLTVSYPICSGEGWLDETKIAPDIVITAIK